MGELFTDPWLGGLLVQWLGEARTAVIVWAVVAAFVLGLALGVWLGWRHGRHSRDRIVVLARVEEASARTVKIPTQAGAGGD